LDCGFVLLPHHDGLLHGLASRFSLLSIFSLSIK